MWDNQCINNIQHIHRAECHSAIKVNHSCYMMGELQEGGGEKKSSKEDFRTQFNEMPRESKAIQSKIDQCTGWERGKTAHKQEELKKKKKTQLLLQCIQQLSVTAPCVTGSEEPTLIFLSVRNPFEDLFLHPKQLFDFADEFSRNFLGLTGLTNLSAIKFPAYLDQCISPPVPVRNGGASTPALGLLLPDRRRGGGAEWRCEHQCTPHRSQQGDLVLLLLLLFQQQGEPQRTVRAKLAGQPHLLVKEGASIVSSGFCPHPAFLSRLSNVFQEETLVHFVVSDYPLSPLYQ